MAEHRRSGKLAVILHADVAGSTELVHQDEHLAHEQIQDTFRRFGDIIVQYHGRVRELRGDALLAEFERASGAVSAALAFQADQKDYVAGLNDSIQPSVRVGIAMGEVVIADNTITGAGVVLAQRLEQLAEPGGVVIQAAAQETIPNRFPFEYTDLGGHEVKGFDKPVQAYSTSLGKGATIPQPDQADHRLRNTLVAIASVAVIAAGVALMWFKPWEVREEPASIERMALPLPNKPSIAVLPFELLSAEPDQDYLGDGLTNDLITALSKFANLFVIASHSSFVYKNKPTKVQTVSEELGVRYVLKGSVQKSVNGVRIHAQLIDALSGRHLWAERYDRQASDLLAIQDEIVESVVANLAILVDAAERERAKGKKTDNLEAYDYYLRADDIRFDWEEATNQRARQLLEKAIELDPSYARAYSALAWTHVNDWRWGWTEDPEASKQLALETARKATELDPFDPESYHALGVVHLYNREFDKAIPLYEKAVALNSNDARRLVGTAPAWIYVGRTEEAVAQIERAMRLNPHHSDNDLNFLGWAYFEAKEYEKALATLKKVEKSAWRKVLTVTYVRLGKMEEARAEVAILLNNDPEYSIERGTVFPYKHEEQWKHYYGALAEAGVPEHPPLKLPGKPSIAVLPFVTLSDDPEQKHFANGLTEDLIASLSKVPDIFVVSRTSTRGYKGRDIDIQQVAKEQGVRYVLEGSIQRSGDTLRVTAQLIDGTNDLHVWAEKYDRSATDFFALQDDIVRQILIQMQVKLTIGDHAETAARGTKNLEAWLLRLQGMAQGFTFTQEGMVRARELFEAAHEADPKWGRPLAAVAWTHHEEADKGWSRNREESIEQGIKLAKQAIELSPEDPLGYMQLGNLMALEGDWDQAIALREKAVELAPNDFNALVGLAFLLVLASEETRALELYQRAKKVSPMYPWWTLVGESLALHTNGEHEQAIQRLKESMKRNPKYPSRLHPRLAALYSDLGRGEEAKKQIEIYLKAKPDATVATTMKSHTFKDKARTEWYADLLRKAGLPD